MATDPHHWLLQNARGLRSLARRLVHGDEVDDLVQDTLARGLERPPADPGSRGAWLRVVCRNLFHTRRRRELRREAHESVSRAKAVAPDTFDIVAHRAAIDELIAALHELPPDAYEVIRLRYFDDLTPTVIAERLSLPLATVKRRLERALIRLREKLVENHDPKDRDWRGALLPLAGLSDAVQSSAAMASPLLLPSKALWFVGTGAVLVATTSWLLVRSPSSTFTDDHASPPAVNREATLSEEQRSANPLKRTVTEPALPVRAPVAASEPVPDSVVTKDDLPASQGQEVDLLGAIVVVDPHGREFPAENGTIQFDQLPGKIVVNAGSFAMRAPAGETLRVIDVALGGRGTVVDESKMAVPADRVLRLRARWPSPTVLAVVDAATGAGLDEIALVSTGHSIGEDQQHPGLTTEVLLEAARSPITLAFAASGATTQTLYARTPGSAWGRITIDHRVGGERKLELTRGGDLDVSLMDHQPREDGEVPPVLRLRGRVPLEEAAPVVAHARRQSERVELEVNPLHSGPTHITGLVPGHYLVAVEVGYHWDPLVLGEAVVTVRAGETSAVTLPLKERKRDARVPLSGTLSLPLAWGELDLSLQLELTERPDLRVSERVDRSQMTAVPGSPGLYRWDAGRVPAGEYWAQIEAFAFQQLIAVGPAGSTGTAIEIGAPVDVSLRVIDEGSGRDLAIDEVSWRCGLPLRGNGKTVPRSPASGRFEFRAPAGRISVQLPGWHPQYGSEHPLVLTPGHNEVTLRLKTVTGILVTLKDGTATVSWPAGDYLNLEPVVGQLHSMGFGRRGTTEQYFTVPEPGRYTVTIPTIEGFEPVPTFEVDLKEGVMLEHAVHLQRRR